MAQQGLAEVAMQAECGLPQQRPCALGAGLQIRRGQPSALLEHDHPLTRLGRPQRRDAAAETGSDDRDVEDSHSSIIDLRRFR